MKLSQYKINSAQVVFLGGNFDMYSVKEFEEFLNGLDIQKYTRLGLNFKELNSIDSSGIGALLRFGREMEKKNAEIAFYDVPGNILTIFINSGLNQIFQIMSTLQFENSFIKETKINSLVYKMKRKYRSFFQKIGSYRNLLAGIILALFCISVFLTEKITYDLEKSKGAELSSFIQSYLWDMDDKNAKDFAEILIETKGYRRIQINHSDGSVFIDAVSKEKPSGFRFLLEQLRVIRSVSIFSDIYHKENKIGRLEIVWINTNIFIHLGSLLLFLLTYSVILSYIRILENRKELNQKNIEVNEQMAEVQRLKVQQDADYFLTSLLTKPFGTDKVRNEKFKIEKLIRQKKKFEFKKRKDEIGGDICITDEIVLKGKKYIVFINADAMGKSLQGAGGILVFSSAVNSILSRNRASVSFQNIFPETWLKNLFIDIHHVFETFNGSMLISGITGLIDEENGFMYWMNAEHPNMVLYRDDTARFLESEEAYMKFGTEGVNRVMMVSTFHLLPGDIIISGSDGRDDIGLGQDESGHAVINSDESLFLRHVETAKANLDIIYENLKAFGEITDDLSLLKIGYSEMIDSTVKDASYLSRLEQAKRFYTKRAFEQAEKLLREAYRDFPKYKDSLRLLLRILYEEKRFAEIILLIEDYVNACPWDLRFILLGAVAFSKTGNYKMGIAYSERYKLRDPHSVKNLFILYELYFNDGNYEKALPVLDRILELEPTNERALSLKGGEYNDEFGI